MKKQNKKWIIIIGIILLVVVMQGKKEGFERTDFSYNDYATNNAIQGGNADGRYFILMDMPLTFTELGRTEVINPANVFFTQYGLNYQFPYSISDYPEGVSNAQTLISEIKSKIITELTSIANEHNLFFESDRTEILSNFNENIAQKTVLSTSTSNGKDTAILRGPSYTDTNNFCDRMNPFFSRTFDDVTIKMLVCNVDSKIDIYSPGDVGICYDPVALTEQDVIDMIEETCQYNLPELSDLIGYAVYDGSKVMLTNEQTIYTSFVSYDQSGSWENYRGFYMDVLDGSRDLTSNMVLNACYEDSDCVGNETCDNNKCSNGEGGIENEDDAFWYESPIIWILGGVLILFLVLFSK